MKTLKQKKSPSSKNKRAIPFARILKWLRNTIIFFLVFSLLQVLVFKFIPVYYSPLMVWRNTKQVFSKGEVKFHHTWKPLNEISPKLPLAVVASEDNLFIDHEGFDFDQIEKAIEEAERGKRKRGASTISQQTAKNVFLWNGRSYLRKGLEGYYTLLIEWIWGKERIMEVYLNTIEMGENLYGAEAVAQVNFKKSAKDLTSAECALIAATLPNPIKFSSAKPSPYLYKRQAKILDLMGKVKPVNFEEKTQEKSDKK